MKVLEYIIRAIDDTKSGLKSAKTGMQGLGTSAEATDANVKRIKTVLDDTAESSKKVKPGLDGIAGSLKSLVEPAHNVGRALMSAMGVVGLVIGTFMTAFDTAKRVMAWTGFFEADTRLKKANETLETAAAIKKSLSEFEETEKTRVAELNDEYDRQSKEVGELTKKFEGLAAAKEKAGASKLNQTMTQIGAQEKAALDYGYDPASVKIAADDARRRAQAEAGISSAQGGIESANRSVADAEEAYALANKHTLDLQDQIIQAEGEKAEARAAMAALEEQFLGEKERAVKERKILMSDRKADITIAIAQKELDKASIGESSAKDAVDVAKANAQAAGEAMKDAMTTRAAAEFDYQSDVADFWNKRDDDDRAAQQDALDAVKAQMDERKKLSDEQAAAEHAKRVEDIKAEAALSEQSAESARDRLSRATSAAQQAWGWYRDPESFKKQLAEEKANAAAEKQYAKDLDKLDNRSDWRTTNRLTDSEESVRRVALAREEQTRAQQALISIEKHTSGLEAMLKTLLTSR